MIHIKKLFGIVLMSLIALHSYAQNDVYAIYPVPHNQHSLAGKATFTHTVNIVADAGIDEVTIARAKQIIDQKGGSTQVSRRADKRCSNIYLGVNGQKGIASNKLKQWKIRHHAFDKKDKFDKHLLCLSVEAGKAQVVILGENTDATFYGLASLEQIFDRGTRNLPCVCIEDYADVQYRGVIEGYYGVPYSAKATKDLFAFMARYKMNSYMYGAKSDPYHSQKWQEAYPDSITAEQEAIGFLSSPMLRDITQTAHQNKVNFIWAIHPGGAFTENKDNHVVDKIMQKFEKMYDLGVRQFGIFVDDVGVPDDSISLALNAKRLTEAQRAVEARWNKNYKTAADTVKPINFVPQLYAYSWVNAKVRHKFFKALSHIPHNVVVYITGANVWSVPNSHDLQVVARSFGRPLAWWWNYPCNDNDISKLFVRDTYTNFADEKWIDNGAKLDATLTGASAIISNPMQQGTASKIALFGVADHAWNHAAFDNEPSYQASLKAVVGADYAKSFDHLSHYLRYYDGEPMKTLIDNYKYNGDPKPLIAEMETVMRECNEMMELKDQQHPELELFSTDIMPWVEKVSDMAYITHQLLQAIHGERAQQAHPDVITSKIISMEQGLDHNGKYKFSILQGMGDDIKLSYIGAEPSQTVMRPFLTYLKKKLMAHHIKP